MAPTVWYHVRDLDEGRRFYRETLGFEETAVDFDERVMRMGFGDLAAVKTLRAAGIVVKENAWRDALVSVLSDADVRERLGAAGVAAIHGGFRMEDAARQYVEAFRELLGPSAIRS